MQIAALETVVVFTASLVDGESAMDPADAVRAAAAAAAAAETDGGVLVAGGADDSESESSAQQGSANGKPGAYHCSLSLRILLRFVILPN